MTAESHDSDSRTPTRCVRLLKVLVVDKDTVYGPAIRLALEEAGYYLNLVTDVHEGCRRVQERAYDLVIVSTSVGTAAVEGILDILSQRVSPPGLIVLADPGELRTGGDGHGVPCLSILRRPCAIDEVIDTARALVGVPWSDHREGA